MKRSEALLIAPLLAFAPVQFSRAQVLVEEAPPAMCTTEGAVVEDGESVNGRTILSRIEEVTSQMRTATSETERDRLFQEFIIPALSCTTADVDAAQLTLTRRPVDPKHPVNVEDLRETLSVFREVLAVQEAADEMEQTPPGFQEEIQELRPDPVFSNI